MARRGVTGCPCRGGTFWTSRRKCGKKALRLVGVALRTPETSIVLVYLLHHFERFLALSASVFINGHARHLLFSSFFIKYQIGGKKEIAATNKREKEGVETSVSHGEGDCIEGAVVST